MCKMDRLLLTAFCIKPITMYNLFVPDHSLWLYILKIQTMQAMIMAPIQVMYV